MVPSPRSISLNVMWISRKNVAGMGATRNLPKPLPLKQYVRPTARASLRLEGLVMTRSQTMIRADLLPGVIALSACDDLVPRDTASLLSPHLHRSEIIGFLAGL